MEKTKRKILVSVVVIAFAIAAIAGGTFAWFTASVTVPENTFTAGTVLISATDSWVTIPSLKIKKLPQKRRAK